jgi:magnesium transporter
MMNTLFLPELREMLADKNAVELRQFCEELHPARAAEFMEGLTPAEAWQVLLHGDVHRRVEIFGYFDLNKQVEIVEKQDRGEVAELISELAADDRVDLLHNVDTRVVEELLPLIPSEDRRDILHLRSYPEGTAGAVMTTQVAMLGENSTVREALDQLQHLADEMETIYYLYIVNDQGHLRGLVSARRLLSAIRHPDQKLADLMETGLVTVKVDEDQTEVADKVGRYDLLAIPVVDEERRMLGIITHDDIMDVIREEATRDAQRAAGVAPLERTYLDTSLLTLAWKRGIWLTVLFIAALLTAFALRYFEGDLVRWAWLVLFLPLVVSSGGNSGNQSATLVITGLASKEITTKDWLRVLRREVVVSAILGLFLGFCGLLVASLVSVEARDPANMMVLPITIAFVVICGSLVGCVLPLIFQHIGLDPALMSNPFVAGIVDIVGIMIYMNVAYWILR